MRLKLLSCKSMAREFSYLSSLSKNNIDATYIRQGFHESPSALNRILQKEIDDIEAGTDPHSNTVEGGYLPSTTKGFDAILLGYGLCSNGIVGLHSEKYKLVVPRAHDCITLFLGSKERYKECFEQLPGSFFYTASWIENSAMPSEETYNRQKEYYLEKGYDEEDLDFFMEEMNSWTRNYKHGVYIKMPFFDLPEYEKFTKEAALFYKWKFVSLQGRMRLFEKLLNGDWNEEDFLILPPGNEIVATGDDRIITSVKRTPLTK